MSETNKVYQMHLDLSEKEHDLLLEKQRLRKQQGLDFLNLEKLIKLYMIEGLFQSTFLEQREQHP